MGFNQFSLTLLHGLNKKMLLKEFFQKQYSVKSREDLQNDPDVGSQIGMGSFGKVYIDNTDSMNVIKIGTTKGMRPEKDGFLFYLYKIKNLKIPVFPQINYIQIYQYQTHEPDHYPEYYYKVGMERLHPSSDLSKEEWIHFINRLTQPYKMIDLDNLDAMELGTIFVSKLQTLTNFGYFDFPDEEEKTVKIKLNDIKDQYFRIAIRTMKKEGKRFNLDLHRENYMFRRTPYGPQIVLTDPFSYPK